MTTQNADLATIDTIDYNGANVTQLIKDGATIWLKQNGIVYYIGKTIWVNGVSSVISSIDGTVVYYTQADGTTGSIDSTNPTGVTETDPNAGNNTGGGGGGTTGPDQDGDGIPDSTDTDGDNDGIPDSLTDLDPFPNVYMSLSNDLQTGHPGLANQVITTPDWGQLETGIYSDLRYLAPVHVPHPTSNPDGTYNEDQGLCEFRIQLDDHPIIANQEGSENWSTHKWYYIEIFGWVPGDSSFPEIFDVRLNRSSDPYDTIQPVKWYGPTVSGDDIKNNNWNNSALLSTDSNYFPSYLNPGQLGEWGNSTGLGLQLIAYTGQMSAYPQELRLRFHSISTFGSQSATNPQPVIKNIQVKMIDHTQASGPSVAPAQPNGTRSVDWDYTQSGGWQWNGIGNNAHKAFTVGDAFVGDMSGNASIIGHEYFVSYPNAPTEFYRCRLTLMSPWPSFGTPLSTNVSAPTRYFTITGGTKDGDSIIITVGSSGVIAPKGTYSAPTLPAGGTLMN